MSWVDATSVILIAIGAIFIPGLVAGTVLQLRGLWLWSLAPAFSGTLYVIVSFALSILSLAWSPLHIAGMTLLLALVIPGIVRLIIAPALVKPPRWRASDLVLSVLSLGIAGATLAWRTMQGITAPDNISQTFDNVFHLNAVAYTLDFENASPLFIGTMTSPESTLAFYPNLWHTFVSIVALVGQTTIPLAVNASNLVILAAVWPLGILILSKQFVRSATLGPVAGALAAASPAFPLYLLHYGVLYPYFLGFALVPAGLAVLVQALGLTRAQKMGRPLVPWVLFGALIPGLAVAHPGALMALLALSVPLVCAATFSGWQSSGKRIRLLRILMFGLYGLIGLVMLMKIRPGASGLWGPRMSLTNALEQSLVLNFFNLGAPIVFAGLTIGGIIYAVRTRIPLYLGLVGMWCVSVLLYVVTAAGRHGRLKLWTAGPWYGDSPRLAPFVVLSAILLSFLAVHWIVQSLRSLNLDIPSVMTAIATVAVLCLTQWGAGFNEMSQRLQRSHELTVDSPLLSLDERRLLDRVEEHVPPEVSTVGSPWTGASLVYAFAHREALLPHMFTNLSVDGWTILNNLSSAHTKPEVCEALRSQGVGFVLDFGTREVHGGEHIYPGLENIDESPAVRLIDSEGEAALYEIIACT